MSELPQPGDLFASRYAIKHLLGRGGFGAVFAARDTSLEREVALKVLLEVSDEQTLARFLREARATAALASEHVATIYEVGKTGDGPYLVMELLRGCDLQDELDDRTRLPVTEAVDLTLQAMLGIAHAHARGIVHRDLKPRNLFLAQRDDGTRVLKVLDFGIAKSSATDLTATGTTLGTPRYMAPEQLRSARTVDARTDIWALGVVVYELVCGRPIFDGDTATQLAVSIVIDPHVPLRTRDPALPAALEAVVDRCLAKEPADRFPDVHALAGALAGFASDAGRALIPRIERALGERAAASAARAAIAIDQTVRESPAKVVGTEQTLQASPPAWQPLGTEQTRQASSPAAARGTEPPAATPARSRAAMLGLALGALALVAILAVVGSRTRSAPAIVDASLADTRVTPDTPVADAPIDMPVADAPIDTPIDAPVADAPVAVVDAPGDAPRPRVPSAPSEAEVEQITNLCMTNPAPVFLVPGNDGPKGMQCARMAWLGCAGMARGCRSIPVTDAERQRCRDFQTALKSAGICR